MEKLTAEKQQKQFLDYLMRNQNWLTNEEKAICAYQANVPIFSTDPTGEIDFLRKQLGKYDDWADRVQDDVRRRP